MHRIGAGIAMVSSLVWFAGGFSSAQAAREIPAESFFQNTFDAGDSIFGGKKRTSRRGSSEESVPGNATDLDIFKMAIVKNESGGRYRAISPPNPNVGGQRAYGKYQVLAGNIGPWTEKAVGRRYSVQEFLDSPDVQERVADMRFREEFEKHGSWDDVAAIWFSGLPYKGNNRCDINMCVPEYVSNMRATMRRLSQKRDLASSAGQEVLPDQIVTPEIARAASKALALHCDTHGCPKGGVNAPGTRYPFRTKDGRVLYMVAEIHSNCADGTNRCPHTGMTVYTR